MQANFIYPKFVAQFYDTIYQPARNYTDKDYYLDKIKQTDGKILEIGVGTGRIFVDALNNGADIYGIDNSPHMIEVLVKKVNHEFHRRIFLANAIDFNLNTTFDLIIAPFRVFAHILEPENQLSALTCIKKHLTTNGIFIFDLAIPNSEWLQNYNKPKMDFSGISKQGIKVERFFTSTTNHHTQIHSLDVKIVWCENNIQNEGNCIIPLRYYFIDELKKLIKKSGLFLKNIYGNYSESELNANSKDYVLICSNKIS